MMSVKLMLALGLLATLSCSGYAIRCHQCSDFANFLNCGFNDEHVVECTKWMTPFSLISWNAPLPAPTGCMKYSFLAKNKNFTYRNCYFGDINQKNTGCQAFRENINMHIDSDLSCDICSGDKCNGSSSLGPMVGVILLFFGVAGLLA